MKALLASLLLIASAASAEPIRPDGIIENVVSTFFFYDTYAEFYEAFPEGEEEGMQGISFCGRSVEKNIAWCDIHMIMPQEVDGEHTLTMGHEVAHGVFGEDYHK